MSKALLVIDMPECCAECSFCKSSIDFEKQECSDYCYITNLEVSGEIISDDCPLKPMPEKKNEEHAYALFPSGNRNYVNGVSDGYNACIDKLRGEE